MESKVSRLSRKRGFTTIELLGVIGVMILLGIVVIISVQTTRRQANVYGGQKRAEKIFGAMENYYGQKMSYTGASLPELDRLGLLDNFLPTNSGGGTTQLNVVGAAQYQYIEPLGPENQKICNQLGEILSSRAAKDGSGKPIISTEGGTLSVTVGNS